MHYTTKMIGNMNNVRKQLLVQKYIHNLENIHPNGAFPYTNVPAIKHNAGTEQCVYLNYVFQIQ